MRSQARRSSPAGDDLPSPHRQPSGPPAASVLISSAHRRLQTFSGLSASTRSSPSWVRWYASPCRASRRAPVSSLSRVPGLLGHGLLPAADRDQRCVAAPPCGAARRGRRTAQHGAPLAARLGCPARPLRRRPTPGVPRAGRLVSDHQLPGQRAPPRGRNLGHPVPSTVITPRPRASA